MRILNHIYKFFALTGAIFLMLPQAAFAMSSSNFQVIFDSFNDGGTSASSANFASGDTIGQTISGASSSANFQTASGFSPGLTTNINAAPPPPPPPPPSGGGGSGFTPAAVTVLSGATAPGATVQVYVSNALSGGAIASAAGNFDVTLTQTGTFTAVLQSTDLAGRKTSLIKDVVLPAGGAIPGLLFPPAFSLSATAVMIGDKLTVAGSSVPNAILAVTLKPPAGGQPVLLAAAANSAGDWSVIFNTAGFSEGSFVVEAKATLGTLSATSSANGDLSKTAVAPPVATPPAACGLIGDLNCDGKVNIQDVSIMLAFFKKTAFPAKYDLDRDGKIDLKDFSILLYHWKK